MWAILGSGTFTLQDASHGVGFLYLAYNPGSNGSYSVGENAYLEAGELCVGASGGGIFTQSGGTVQSDRYLDIGLNSGDGGVQPQRNRPILW